jgi:acetoin utilization deacetylase AcuC-like enzyme
MRVFYSSKCLRYWQEGHSESPERIREAYKFLKKYFEFYDAKPCSENDLLTVHSPKLVNKVKQGNFFDLDTPNLKGMYDYAKLSAGSAILALRTAVGGENAFSLMRPPGHHAGKNFLGGFCYFNNIAIAVEKALKLLNKIAILDIDGHHGNGTQDIFLGRKDVLYVSLHQKNAFPLTGFISERNCINYPLLPGIKEEEYLEVVEKALEKIQIFKPDLIAVSAGFDTYKKDPLVELELSYKTYWHIGGMISFLGKPVASVLEGGYHKDMGKCIQRFLSGLE